MKLLTFSNASDCKRRAKMEFLLGKALCFTFISLLTDDCLKSSPCLRTRGAGRVTDFTARFCGDVLPGHLTCCTMELASPGNLQVPLILWALSFASLMFCSPAVTSPPRFVPPDFLAVWTCRISSRFSWSNRTFEPDKNMTSYCKSHEKKKKPQVAFTFLISLVPSTVCMVPL